MPRQAGFALVFVLAVMLIIVFLVTETLTVSREQVSVASAIERRAKARASADGAIWYAAAALSDSRPVDIQRAETLLGSKLEISVRRHGDLVNVNRASLEDITTAARDAGLPDPGAFASAIMTRRAAFAAAGISPRLNARAFQTLADALALVPPDLRAALSGRITVYQSEAPAVVTLRAEAETAGGGKAVREAILSIADPVVVLEWR